MGVDYAVGEPTAVGTELVAALVRLMRAAQPGCGVVADPEVDNAASRRLLEKNGFELVALKPLASEPTGHLMAIYHLPAEGSPSIGLGRLRCRISPSGWDQASSASE